MGFHIIFNGDVGNKIGEGPDKHIMFLDRGLCTYRYWELIGRPCAHAMCALWHAKVDPLTVMFDWYHKCKFIATYKTPMQHVPRIIFIKCDEYLPIEPPPLVKLAGRPRTKRVRGAEEQGNSSKLSKKAQNRGVVPVNKKVTIGGYVLIKDNRF